MMILNLKALTAVFIVREIGIDGFPAHRESFMRILILSEYSQRENLIQKLTSVKRSGQIRLYTRIIPRFVHSEKHFSRPIS